MRLLFTLCFAVACTASLLAQEGLADRKQFNAAVLYHTQGDYQAAIEGFSRLIAGHPDYVKAYFFRGYAYLKLHDEKNALADFKIAAELDPTHAKAFFYIGKIHYNQGQYEKAIAAFSQSLALDPQQPYALNDRGMCHYQMGYYSRAIESFKAAIAVDPDFAMAHNNLGSAIFFNQDVDKPDARDMQLAREAFTQALALDPQLFLAYYNRATMYYFLQDFPRAMADVEMALALQPQNAMCWLYRAMIFRRTEQYALADESLSKALELNPAFPPALEEKGHLRRATRQYTAAIGFYRAAGAAADDRLYRGLMHYYEAQVHALQEDEASTYAALKSALKLGAFRDQAVYQSLLKHEVFRPFKYKDGYQKIVKRARKGEKVNKFTDSSFLWFRFEQ